jgi:hypothetical protein
VDKDSEGIRTPFALRTIDAGIKVSPMSIAMDWMDVGLSPAEQETPLFHFFHSACKAARSEAEFSSASISEVKNNVIIRNGVF